MGRVQSPFLLHEQPQAEPSLRTELCLAELQHSWVGHKGVTAVLKDEVSLPFPSPPKSCCTWITSCGAPAPPSVPLPLPGHPEQGIQRGPGQPTLLAGSILTPAPGSKRNVLHSGTLLCETWTGGTLAFAHRTLTPAVFLLHFPSMQGCTSSAAVHGEEKREQFYFLQ